ncbi:hypothetical protein A3D70_00750 [Candidatus Adlerbacteria bacterium RIFCSPHIGHO2_02_FULL_54_18]|uniref:Methyltransferase domain-containing protein n=1 Tax=Candidatus Adlerbacteria bacterium RIFCSPHIGHO2_02_FULL_54_18 TaxID=1797241 RepID=A0A1F4Y3D4_9BACT|nr:MAG: hypothetical protein A3D70_00750 [Candidatus Adlerbacteria bacterium RIFCSPHIGHO2_02_FULL_54_18]
MEESSFLNPGRTLIAAKVAEGMRVADFGCGSGFFTRAAARLVGQSGLVWAVDAHQDILSRVKNLSLQEGLTNVEVVHGDVERKGGSRLPEENFDLVIITNLLFGAEHKDMLAREAGRVLHKGGRVLVVDWRDSFGGLGPHKDHVVSSDHARTLFELHGFVWESEVPAGEFHWGFLARKKGS